MPTIDRETGHKVLGALPLLAAAFAVTCLGGCGCHSDEEQPSLSAVEKRAGDEAYQKALQTHRDIQKGIMREVDAARQAYDNLKSSGADMAGEAAQKAKAGIDAAMDKLAAERKAAAELIRQRLQRGVAEDKANISKEQKGK